MKNITRACSYVAGIDSLGMQSLKAYHTELTDKQIEKLDPLNANNCLPDWFFTKKRRPGTQHKEEKNINDD
jgi:hypothetical protein